MDSSSKPLLRIEGLTKRYTAKKGFFKEEHFFALQGVSFEVYPSEIVAVVGESGSGKSTIGKIVAGLIKPTDGKVYYQDIDISSRFPKHIRKEISVIFQDPRTSLNPRFKVFDILAEPLTVNRYDRTKIEDRVVETLNLVQLNVDFADRYPHELSGGQRQRVAIARAIILNPKLVIADEPTSALDVSIQLQIVNLIKDLNREKKIAFLFISHDIGVVSSLSDRTVVLYRGKVMEQGKTDQIITDPKHPYTKLLIDSLPPTSPQNRKVFPNIEENTQQNINFEGCEFFDRCPVRSEVCVQKPQLKKVGSREVYCHFA